MVVHSQIRSVHGRELTVRRVSWPVVIASAAFVLSATSAGVVIYRTLDAGDDRPQFVYTPDPEASPEANEGYATLINELHPKERLNEGDVETLIDMIMTHPEQGVRTFAMVMLAESYGDGRLPAETDRDFLTDLYTHRLASESWRERSCALFGLRDLGVMDDERVRSQMEALRDDPEERVRLSAQKVLDGR